MKRMRILGLCLVAVFAISAVAAATAAAEEPTYKVCTKASPKESGKFNDKNCSVSSKGGPKEGDYELAEWTAAKKKTFKDKALGKTLLDVYVRGVGVVASLSCLKSKSTGTIVGRSSAIIKLTDEKCTSGGKVCASAGAKPGNIVTTFLSDLRRRRGFPKRVLDVARPVPPAKALAEFSCEGENVTVGGSVASEITGDINTIAKTSTETATVNAGGENEITETEEEPGEPHVLTAEIEGVGTFEAGLATTSENKGEALEIEA